MQDHVNKDKNKFSRKKIQSAPSDPDFVGHQ